MAEPATLSPEMKRECSKGKTRCFVCRKDQAGTARPFLHRRDQQRMRFFQRKIWMSPSFAIDRMRLGPSFHREYLPARHSRPKSFILSLRLHCNAERQMCLDIFPQSSSIFSFFAHGVFAISAESLSVRLLRRLACEEVSVVHRNEVW